MSTISQMNSANNLSLNYSISNMPFDESIEFHNSDYITSEAMDELKERVCLEIEDINAYDKVFDCLPPLPPTKEEDDDSIDTFEECSRLERERDDAYDRAFENKILKEYPELYKNLPSNSPTKEEEEEEDDDSIDMIEQQTYKGVFYANAMEMEAEIMKDIKYKIEKEFREKNSKLMDKIGDGNMEYIKNEYTREMFTNAWKAITFTNNWDFVAQDIDSFMWSNDPRIDEITEKMIEFGYDGHSGSSFGCTMRNMQYLVQNGEEKFKKLFDENAEKGVTKFLDYSGGF